ncbi:unnamed protein product, partial [Scytosiphon promiscuus]
VRDLPQKQAHTRAWVSLRHRLHETLVESGTRGIERLQSLPKMSELVTNIRSHTRDTRSSGKTGEPLGHLRRDGVPPARRLYEGTGCVKRLSSSALRGKRVINGPFEVSSTSHGTGAAADVLSVSDDMIHGAQKRDENGGEHHASDAEKGQLKDAADYLDFLSSEFMVRLDSGGGGPELRRQSRWKRSFEQALEKRRRKQEKSDEFFEIYRQ